MCYMELIVINLYNIIPGMPRRHLNYSLYSPIKKNDLTEKEMLYYQIRFTKMQILMFIIFSSYY